jgi:hypothetical protein
VLRKRGEKELACEQLWRQQALDYSLHEHGKSVAIDHCYSHELPRAHEWRRVEEHGGKVALTVTRDLRT